MNLVASVLMGHTEGAVNVQNDTQSMGDPEFTGRGLVQYSWFLAGT